jgi:hypothetical protein
MPDKSGANTASFAVRVGVEGWGELSLRKVDSDSARLVATMKEHYDPWFVRLPDGRTIKAKSTSSVRHHVESGHIPLNSMMRRDSNEEWVALVWVAEFADLVSPSARTMAPPTPPPERPPQLTASRSGVSARLDPMRLQTVGVRGLIDELIAALDSTLARSKMVPAFLASLLIFLAMFAAHAVFNLVFVPKGMRPEQVSGNWLPGVIGAAFAVLVLSVLNAVLSRMTHTEVSTMRPARLREAMKGVAGYAVPVVIANTLVAGGALAFLFLLIHIPDWSRTALTDAGMNATLLEVAYTPILVVVQLLSVLVWLVVGLCWLIGPAIVVEESSWIAGIREWRQLVREHFGRVLVYEGLALMLGLAVALPLTAAVSLALNGRPAVVPAWPVGGTGGENWITGGVNAALESLTLAPMLAVIGVANVFIYLNLRYEQGPGR